MIEALKDSKRGETCVIIGNGRSLRDMPPNFFTDYYTLGSNLIFLLQTQPELAPPQLAGLNVALWAAVNPLVISQNWDKIDDYRAPLKFISGYPPLYADPACMVGTLYSLQSLSIPHFSDDIIKGIYEGYTVTYVLMQIAYYMGFKRALLIGVDHYYEYAGAPNAENNDTRPDVNHFHDSYFSGQRWHNPDLERSTAAYRLAKNAYERDGREIINLTTTTALDVFPKDDYKQWI